MLTAAPSSHGRASFAVCAIAKNEAPYLSEWVAFHLLQGASEFIVFDNESTDSTKETLQRLAKHAPIRVMDWSGSDFHIMQRSAYLSGARELADRADWVAFIDIDEFLFSSKFRSLPDELDAFGPEVGAIAVGHRVFGSSGERGYRPDFVTSRFVRCAGPDNPQGRWFKTIARPSRVLEFDSAHSVVLIDGNYLFSDHTPLTRDDMNWHPGHAGRVVQGAISLHHYMVKSREEFHGKQERFAGKNLEHRHTDGFFDEHDSAGNEVENSDLLRFSEALRETVARWS